MCTYIILCECLARPPEIAKCPSINGSQNGAANDHILSFSCKLFLSVAISYRTCLQLPPTPTKRLLVCESLHILAEGAKSLTVLWGNVSVKATDENLASEDWALNIDVCDKVTGDGQSG